MRIITPFRGGGGTMLMTELLDPSQTQKRVKLELNIANSSKQVNYKENKHLAVKNLDRDCTV
jgi:hypothetical protein